MPLEVREVSSPADFDAILPVLFAAYEEPHNAFFRWFNPIMTTRDDAMRASAARHASWWQADDSCRWVTAVDQPSGAVVGAAAWLVHREPPGAGDAAIEADWFPRASEEKAFAERLIGSIRAFIGERMAGRAHVELDQMVVGPQHRRRGVAAALMQWGVAKADELHVETVIGSTPFARPAYERMGFGTIDAIHPAVAVAHASDQWRRFQADDLHAYLMWRPPGRAFAEGDRAPWSVA